MSLRQSLQQKRRGKALQSSCLSSLLADLSQPATPRFALFTKPEGRSPLHPLQTGKIGFRATHSKSASAPSRQGLAGVSSRALSPSPGQRWLQETSAFSPFSHACSITAATVQEKSDTTGQRDRCSTRQKWGEALAPTRASSALRLPQEKLRQKFFRNAKKALRNEPERAKTPLFKCLKRRQAPHTERRASHKIG